MSFFVLFGGMFVCLLVSFFFSFRLFQSIFLIEVEVRIVTYRKMEEYTESEKFFHYIERLELFLATKGIEDTPENTGRRKAILQNDIASKTYGLVRDLLATDKNYSEIALKKHFQPKSSEVVWRFKFCIHAKKTDKRIANFVADLKLQLRIMIRDRIVCGINEDNTQRRLVFDNDLTFKRSFEIAQGMEATWRFVAELSDGSQSGGGKQEV